jgi:hypothetical protein
MIHAGARTSATIRQDGVSVARGAGVDCRHHTTWQPLPLILNPDSPAKNRTAGSNRCGVVAEFSSFSFAA